MIVPIKRGTARRLGLRRPTMYQHWPQRRIIGSLPPPETWRVIGDEVIMRAEELPLPPGLAERMERYGLTWCPEPTTELRVQTWTGGEWIKGGDRIDYQPGAAQ